MSQSNYDKTPRQKALESRTKPAEINYTDGRTAYAEFAEWRDGGYVYIRPVEYLDDEERVGKYVPAHQIKSVVRLNGGN